MKKLELMTRSSATVHLFKGWRFNMIGSLVSGRLIRRTGVIGIRLARLMEWLFLRLSALVFACCGNECSM